MAAIPGNRHAPWCSSYLTGHESTCSCSLETDASKDVQTVFEHGLKFNGTAEEAYYPFFTTSSVVGVDLGSADCIPYKWRPKKNQKPSQDRPVKPRRKFALGDDE